MIRIPFSVYDFFGCIAAGFVLLAAGDYAFDHGWLLRQNLTLVEGAFWIVAAYITGHIVANVGSFLLEGWFVREVLRSPEETLFGAPTAEGWRRLFPGHHTTLPAETRQRVLRRAADKMGLDSPGRALFFHCHPIVIRDQTTRERLDRFLYLYGFCRNVCMALLLACLLLLLGVVSNRWRDAGVGDDIWWAIIAAGLAAVGMFYRYLKFFREYTIEVFRTYGEPE